MARCIGTRTPMNLSNSPYWPLPVLNQANYPARFPCAAGASSRFKAARPGPVFIAFFAIFGRLFRGSAVLTVMGIPRSERADECDQVYGQATTPAVPRMEDIPSQSCRWDRRDRSVRRADNLVSSALWTADRGARPTTDRMARRHSASDRGMDRKSDYGSFRLGTGSPLSDPRLRSGLWHCLHPTTSINGHSRPTNVATLPVSKWIS